MREIELDSTSFSAANLQELRRLDGVGFIIEFLYAQNHAQRVSAIENAIDSAYMKLAMNCELYTHRSEDEITISIVNMLEYGGINIAHERKVGGHCDITVRALNDFLWIAEAKIHGSYGWLDKGYKQLSTRYSTGLPGQDCGELIIYCKIANAKDVLQKWRDELLSRNSDVDVIEDETDSQLRFRSRHIHQRSGLPF